MRSDCTSFVAAINVLGKFFIKIKIKKNIFVRYLLAARQQVESENIDEFFQELQILSKNRRLEDVTAEQYCQELFRHAFINGILFQTI